MGQECSKRAPRPVHSRHAFQQSTGYPRGFEPSAILLVLVASSRVSFADDPKLNTPPQKEAPTAFAAPEPSPVQDWSVAEGKSYLVPV
jgi:hypothetical protein